MGCLIAFLEGPDVRTDSCSQTGDRYEDHGAAAAEHDPDARFLVIEPGSCATAAPAPSSGAVAPQSAALRSSATFLTPECETAALERRQLAAAPTGQRRRRPSQRFGHGRDHFLPHRASSPSSTSQRFCVFEQLESSDALFALRDPSTFPGLLQPRCASAERAMGRSRGTDARSLRTHIPAYRLISLRLKSCTDIGPFTLRAVVS